jgi:glutamate racemase
VDHDKIEASKERIFMLKIVVFDSGYGGELFADYLENELPVMDIIRVIDWRHADEMQNNARYTRHLAEEALKPYIGKVDLIVFANYLLSITSLRYFQRKYKNQRFIGVSLNHPANYRYRTAILTTKAVARTIRYKLFAHQIGARTCVLDDWPILIDDGELGHAKIRRDLKPLAPYKPEQLIFTCTQFADLESELRRIFGHNTKIINNYEDAIHDICQILRIRGALKKQK